MSNSGCRVTNAKSSEPGSPSLVCVTCLNVEVSAGEYGCVFFQIKIVITLKKPNSFEVVIQMCAEIIPRLSTKCSQLFILGERAEGGEVHVPLI